MKDDYTTNKDKFEKFKDTKEFPTASNLKLKKIKLGCGDNGCLGDVWGYVRYCPRCDAMLFRESIYINYCSNCGQRLILSENDIPDVTYTTNELLERMHESGPKEDEG